MFSVWATTRQNNKQMYRIWVQQCITRQRMAHCFRHPETPLFSFLSLSVNERLTSLRLVGRRSEVSDSQMERFSFSQSLGIGDDPPVGGFPLVRGQTGCVIRWGAGWFEEVRDQLGWRVRKDDKPESNKRHQNTEDTSNALPH